MTRTIPPSHRSITGSLPTRYPPRQLHYESKLERDFLILLEIDPGIETVVTQPITIDLVVDGRRRRYTPDVLAVWWDDVAKDIEGLEASDVVFAILNGLDPGTIFEIGYAIKKAIPVVALAQNVKEEDLKMIVGTGCEVTDDFASGLYRAVWKLP
jgi:hypothetical protein